MYNTASIGAYKITISNAKHYLILFILWPFLAFITAIANYKQREAKRVVYIFLIYYGLTFVINNEGIDAYRYAMRLAETAQLPFKDFFKILGGLYSDTSVDIMDPFLTFLVSRITIFHGLYFAVWAAIMGFFYLKSINLLYSRFLENPGWNGFIFLTFFVFLMPITNLFGVRMPTATWVFFFGAYHVVYNKNPKYFLLTFFAGLIHWSFFSANAVLLIYYLLGNRNLIYFPLVVFSFFLPRLLFPVFEAIAIRIGGPILARFEGYTSELYVSGIEEHRAQSAWFLTLSDDLLFYYILITILIIQLLYRRNISENGEKNMFSFTLLFLSFINFGQAIPTLGGRFQDIFYLFAIFYIFLQMVKIPGKRIEAITGIGLFPMLLYAVVMFRIGSVTINAWLFMPGLGVPLLNQGTSIADILFF